MDKIYEKQGGELVIKTNVVVEERLSMDSLLSVKERLERELSEINEKINQATVLNIDAVANVDVLER